MRLPPPLTGQQSFVLRQALPMKRVTVRFEGNVQGVGFRWTAARAARDAGVAGWVRNESDGSVQLVAEGGEAQIEALLESIRAAMAGNIHRERLDWSEARGEFNSFEIRR